MPVARPLTQRQREVLGLIVAGEADKSIALRLGISLRCVSRHAAQARQRLGAVNRAQAVAIAVSASLQSAPLIVEADAPSGAHKDELAPSPNSEQ